MPARFCPSSNIPYIGEIGLQLYTLRKAIAKDLTKTLEEVAKLATSRLSHMVSISSVH